MGLPLSDIVLFCFDDDESVFSSSFAYNVSFFARKERVFTLLLFGKRRSKSAVGGAATVAENLLHRMRKGLFCSLFGPKLETKMSKIQLQVFVVKRTFACVRKLA